MHSLSESLLAAQRDRAAVPYVHAMLAERWGGVTQLRWERLTSGQEPVGPHAAVITSGGSLIRIRAQANPNGLFVQRIASPGPDSQFGMWQNLGETAASGGVAVTEIDGQIHVLDVAANQRTIRERTSRDDGLTFGSPRTVATAAANVTSLAAASGAGGGALLLYAESTGIVRSITRTAGTWSSPSAWTNSLRTVDGIACGHIDGDWAVVACGTLSNRSSGVWTCNLGAGSSQTAGTWSMLREVIASAPGADVTYRDPGVCAADGPRISFVEAYGGAAGYSQTMTTHASAGARFRDHRWRESTPFGQIGGTGPALAAEASFAWLTTPSEVWRAHIGTPSIDISGSVIAADMKETPRGASVTLVLAEGPQLDSSVTVGSGPLGHELSIAWGYETGTGRETGQAQRYWVREVRRETRRGSLVTVLEAEDPWWFMAKMRARRQLTWPAHTASVWNILSQLLTMAGMSTTLARSSPAIVATYPAITISPNESLAVAITRLMSRVPDVLRFSDGVLEAIRTRETDPAVYFYGEPGDHALLDVARSSALSPVNHVQVYGHGAIAESVNQREMESVGSLLVQVVDRSLTTPEVVATRADAELRSRGVLQPFARITVPVNAGQQLHDVVSVTAPSVGWASERLRVAGLRTRYDIGTSQPVYQQDIELGGV
ncbi:MAG: hypothetical protein OXC55_00540 [Chloroflexi bacterium]|nr:hypothetical protein [Chloroflexota bacterium]